MKKVNLILINQVITEATLSPRRRAIYRFHQLSDALHRMINAIQPESYIRPHRHKDPDKVEAFVILKGEIAIIEYDDNGQVTDFCILSKEGETQAVEIAARTWHSSVCLKQDSVLYEVIEGPYHEDTHKKFPLWAPAEDDKEEGRKFVENLKQFIFKNRDKSK